MVFGVLNIGVVFSRLLLPQRRQEEGVKNECVVFVMKKPISEKEDSRKDVDAYPLQRTTKRKGCL